MTLFYILLLILGMGGGAIAWIMIAEKKKESPEPEKVKETAPQLSPKDLLGRLGLDNPKQPTDKVILSELFQKNTSPTENTTTNTAKAVNLAPSVTAESELSLKYDELLTQQSQLKAEHTKLEALFVEKSKLLEKSEKTLSNELKNQKEFYKVKDILEKEIRDYKDKTTALQGEVTTAQTETQTQLKRIDQLEKKVKKLEIEVLTSEAAINDAQASTQLARKHSSDLEEKIRALENQILDKNQKIEDLVSRLKDLPNIFPGNTLPDPQASLNRDTTQQPPAESQAKAPPLAESTVPPPISEKEANVVQQGGEQNKLVQETPTPEPQETKPKESIPTNIEVPKAVPLIDQQSASNPIIEKPGDGPLTLPPDILTKEKIESIEPPKPNPPDLK